MNRIPSWIMLVLLAACVGCAASEQSAAPQDTGFGERVDDGADGRATVVITSVPNAADYDVSAAPYESVDVRVGSMTSDGVPVELLIKGALPDSCTELHGVNQTRSGDEVIVQLQARRPNNAMCATVVRPYRFYLTLEGMFDSGFYTLELNGVRQNFNVN